MAKQNKVIDITCGVYQTEYRLIAHRDGSFSVKSPYVKWVGNTGHLAFNTTVVPKKRQTEVLEMFKDRVTLTSCGRLTLEDCLGGC